MYHTSSKLSTFRILLVASPWFLLRHLPNSSRPCYNAPTYLWYEYGTLEEDASFVFRGQVEAWPVDR
jgi:hypothetical protein